jgi:EmrB/QacA subfamily drug resistance transporter
MNVRGKWSVVIALASAQFIMVLDGTVMNVSIQKVITDLDTSVTEMQLAISTYTLTMAALMMVGGKVGDIIGRRRAFRIGLALFGLGAGITAAAPSIGVLILGWSVIEAIGAALMIPAVAALITGNYEGRNRAISFGIIGGMAGAGAACGPIIGGWISTTWSWRYVFAAEIVIVLLLLAASTLIKDAPRKGRKPTLDGIGALLSASGVALTVLGIVQSTDWGWIAPKESLEIGGTAIEPFGFSVVPFLILAGLALLAAFARWEEHVTDQGRDPLVQLKMLRIPRLRAGLMTSTTTMLALGGTFFVLPLYLQIVLGKDPLETGVHMLPLSVAVFFTALSASRLSSRFSPRSIVRAGQGTILAGVLLLLVTIEQDLESLKFFAAMAIAGTGMGMIMSQLGNVNLSAVKPDQTSEVGGLQGTSQNLGSALGTALIGSILLTSLTGSFDREVAASPQIPAAAQSEVKAKTSGGLQFVPASAVERSLAASSVPQAVSKPLVDDYEDSQIRGLKTGLGGVAVVVLLGFLASRGLPREPLNPKGA